MRLRYERPLILGALLLLWSRGGSAQEVVRAKVAYAGATAPAVAPRFRSPRATVRAFLMAMNRAEDDPRSIEDAVACLDLAGLPDASRRGGRLAFELEFILRSTNIPTYIIPDLVEGSDCEIGEGNDIKLRLHRLPDGRWFFEGRTLRDLPRLRLLPWDRAVAAGQSKDSGDAPAESRSPHARSRTYIDALKKGDLDRAARCLDLAEVPGPARRIVGRALAFKLKEVLDRNLFIIFQDIPDTSAGMPLEAVVHGEGRITAERQSAGKREGQWLHNEATVRPGEALYDEFEAKPLVPELAAMGGTAGGPAFRGILGLIRRGPEVRPEKYEVAL